MVYDDFNIVLLARFLGKDVVQPAVECRHKMLPLHDFQRLTLGLGLPGIDSSRGATRRQSRGTCRLEQASA
jgi:hypothetical protein